jgi:glucose-6-phosphate-specific signal transduction histidine kinase
MTTLPTSTLSFSILFSQAILYVPVIVLAWKYHQNNRPLAGLLTIYAALASGAQLIDVAGHMGLLSGLDTEALLRLDLYTTLILAAILMGMVTAFFENRYGHRCLCADLLQRRLDWFAGAGA